jgi:hypothetical protein
MNGNHIGWAVYPLKCGYRFGERVSSSCMYIMSARSSDMRQCSC